MKYNKTFYHIESDFTDYLILCDREKDYLIPCSGREGIFVDKDQAALVLKNNFVHKFYRTTADCVPIPPETDSSGFLLKERGVYNVVWFNLGIIKNLHAVSRADLTEDCMKNVPDGYIKYIPAYVNASVSYNVRIKTCKKLFNALSRISGTNTRFNLCRAELQEYINDYVSVWMEDWIYENAGRQTVHEFCTAKTEQAITRDLEVFLQKKLSEIGLELIKINNSVQLRPSGRNLEIMKAARRRGIIDLNQLNRDKEYGTQLKDISGADINAELKLALIRYLNSRAS